MTNPPLPAAKSLTFTDVLLVLPKITNARVVPSLNAMSSKPSPLMSPALVVLNLTELIPVKPLMTKPRPLVGDVSVALFQAATVELPY
jgi:hypothetical protein